MFLDYKKQGRPANEYYLAISNFRKTCNLQFVSIQHQKEIEDYFLGRINFSSCIDETLREQIKTEKKNEGKNKIANPSLLLSDMSVLEEVDLLLQRSLSKVESAE